MISNKQHIHAGRKGRGYILIPTEHVCAHLQLLRNKSLVKEVNPNVKSENFAKDQSENITLTSIPQKTFTNTKITIKPNKNLKMGNIGSTVDPGINIFETSKDCLNG